MYNSKQATKDNECDDVFQDSSLFENFDNSTFIDTTKNNESDTNNCLDKSALNVSALCCDEEISGYDKLTGEHWVYPTNYPVRDYQFNIIKSALLKNTLVSLPTGLGKTFIAAVVMYNFYRWYPLGKIVFTAPTRPLVAQQIEACYNIVAIPPKDTIEMTGHMNIVTRKAHWQSKRVFFATPQVIYNDIKSGICPAEKLRCLVIDEAHRARGNYAYCQIIGTLTDMGHRTYRVLALSATPGSKVSDVITVVNNLHIAHLELRSDNCIDVAQYSHSRKINTVIIELGPELTQLRNQYVEIIDGYTRRLKQFSVLPQNLGNLSKGRVVMLYKEFQTKERNVRHPQHNYIMKDLTILIALYHGLELLVKHGSRVFLNFFDEHTDRAWIQSDDRLTMLLERLRDDLGVNPLSLDRSVLPDGTIPEIPKDLTFGHPKFNKLKEIMIEHFTNAKRKGEDTRAIVFCEYRESVNLVHCLLLQCRPLIVPQMFVGQGVSGREGGSTQRAQARAVRAFREGAVNVLVSTCVAEEGLDVGAVDLCVCFDVSTRSPVRLVQRCGRTGRARGGQVYILVTEGREHQTLLDSIRQRDALNSKILQSKEVRNNLYKMNPRMLPRDFTPECKKMFITVKSTADTNDKVEVDKSKKKQKDLRSMLLGRPSTSNSSKLINNSPNTGVISKEDFNEIYPEGYRESDLFAEPVEYCCMSIDRMKQLSNIEGPKLKLSTWLEWQRTLQQTVNVGHSSDSDILVHILQYSDTKRFETLPLTQNQEPISQNIQVPKFISSPAKVVKPANKRKQKVPLIKSPIKRDGDIRALFSTATKSTKNYTKLLNDLGIQNDGSLPTWLISLLVDLSLETSNASRNCYICSNLCNCKIIRDIRNVKKTISVMLPVDSKPNLPDINLIDDFDVDLITMCNRSINLDIYGETKDESVVNDKEIDCSKNFDLQFDFDSLDGNENVPTKEENNNLDKNFDIGDIEDIFAASSPEECSDQNRSDKQEMNSKNPKETLGFFGLESLDDIFADSDEEDPNEPKEKELTNSVQTNLHPIPSTSADDILSDQNKETKENKISSHISSPKSPSLLSGRLSVKSPSASTSPILCSQVRRFQLSRKKRLFNSTPTANTKKQRSLNFDDNNSATSNKFPKSILDTGDDSKNKSMLTITQLVEIINGNNESSVSKTSNISSDLNHNKSTHLDEKSPSPILLTQKDKHIISNNSKHAQYKTFSSQAVRSQSLIILDSDSDSNEATEEYELNDIKLKDKDSNKNSSFIGEEIINHNNKRKFDDSDLITNSPYFSKKPKVESSCSKPLTLQEKVLAALSTNNIQIDPKDNNKTINFMTQSPILYSQKENINIFVTNKEKNNVSDINDKSPTNPNIEMLQMFKRSKNTPKNNKNRLASKKIFFDCSDDDAFVENEKTFSSPKVRQNKTSVNRVANYKVRKKKNIGAQFIDEEAELSDDRSCESGDELSDESVGSIIDFICDDNPNQDETGVDMQAYYIRSVKSPVKGVFKIPELPKKFNNAEVLSQYVEEDTYEMDSFCVDSHIGLTQVNEMSELEIAEKILEEKKKRRKVTGAIETRSENDESPLIRRKFKSVRRAIRSDSEESD